MSAATPRLVQAGRGSLRPIVIVWHVTIALDSAIRAALGPDPCIVNVTAPPSGERATYDESTAAAGYLSALVAGVATKQGFTAGPLVLVGFSAGCRAVRACLRAGNQPAAVVAIDGTHGNWPTRTEDQIAPWRAAFDRARQDPASFLFAASHSGLTYVEGLKPNPYASTWRVLREVTGWPLAVAKGGPRPVVTREGGAVVFSTDAQDHVAQARVFLPKILAEAVRPFLAAAVAALPPAALPAPEPPPAAGVRLPAEKTPASPAEVAVALGAGWLHVLGEVPPSKAAIALLLAQWALETGRGRAMWCNNLGNVKAGGSWPGDFCFFACNEILTSAQAASYVARAKPRTDGKPGLDAAITTHRADGSVIVWFYPDNPGAKFRAFKTLAEGAADHVRLLVNHRTFKRAWPFVVAAKAGSPSEIDATVRAYVSALKAAGYFTADLEPYYRGVRALFVEFLKLDFDLPVDDPDAPGACGDGLCEDDRAAVLSLVGQTIAASVWEANDDGIRAREPLDDAEPFV